MKIRQTPLESTATPVVLVEFFANDFFVVTKMTRKVEQVVNGEVVLVDEEYNVQTPASPFFSTSVVAPAGSDYEAMAMSAYQTTIAPQEPYKPSYQHERKIRYPDMEMYLDGVVKQYSTDPVVVAEGVVQVAEYAAQCLAVKALIPKV